MAKISFQDVVPPGKRSIRNVSINSAKKSKAQSSNRDEKHKIIQIHKEIPTFLQEVKRENTENSYSTRFNELKINHYSQNPIANSFDSDNDKRIPPKQKYYFEEDGSGRSKTKILLFGTIGAIIIAFIVFIMTVFSSATVIITPKVASVNPDLSIKLSSDGSAGIKYEMLKISKSKNVYVQAKNEEMVEKKASGKIVIYNNFSTEPQRLISRTRFETQSGLIYRIPESIIVPGKRLVDGKEIPGNIEVEVFADEAGEKYNIGKTDFTIPGFKTDKERYTNFYAKSSTEMSGGFIGKMKTVSESDRKTALSKIELELRDELKKDIMAQIPDGLVALPNSIIYTKKELPQKEDGSSVVLTLEISANALLLPKTDLSKEIYNGTLKDITDWDTIETRITNFENLSINIGEYNPLDGGSFDVRLTGNAIVEAVLNEEIIKQKLIGSKQKDMSQILDDFHGIMEAKSVIRPIWKKSFPSDLSKIYIKLVGNQTIDSNS